MSVQARMPENDAERDASRCTGCGGAKAAPIAMIVNVGHVKRHDVGTTDVNAELILCEECGRDAANVIGFMCIKDGGWSKLEPRKRKATPQKINQRRSSR